MRCGGGGVPAASSPWAPSHLSHYLRSMPSSRHQLLKLFAVGCTHRAMQKGVRPESLGPAPAVYAADAARYDGQNAQIQNEMAQLAVALLVGRACRRAPPPPLSASSSSPASPAGSLHHLLSSNPSPLLSAGRRLQQGACRHRLRLGAELGCTASSRAAGGGLCGAGHHSRNAGAGSCPAWLPWPPGTGRLQPWTAAAAGLPGRCHQCVRCAVAVCCW